MAANIFSAFGQYAGLISIAKWIGYIFLALIASAILTLLIIGLMILLKSVRIQEINMVNRKVKFYRGRFRKNKEGIKMLWVARLKKFIPQIQEKDTYIRGKSDMIILLKDNNGLHHTCRIPNFAEIKKWYKYVYGVDINDNVRLKQSIKTIYLLPNPSEDLDWLANQVTEAKKEFATAWWQSPTVMIIGTAALCVFMFIMSALINKKM